MTKTALVDMDGVLADFDGRYVDRAWALSNGVNPFTNGAPSRFKDDQLSPEWRHLAKEIRSEIYGPGWFRNLAPMPGALDGLRELAEHADVWICTKPLDGSAHCRDEKAEWVREHLGDDWVKRIILAPDKSMVRGDVLLDDAIKAGQAEVATWEPVVYPHMWNRSGTRYGQDWRRWAWGDSIAELLGTEESMG